MASTYRLQFDYGSKTFHFGAGLDEAEAFELVRRIAERFPQLAKSPGAD